MDEFSYHNLFDTKGIEYIVIIAFLLLLIPFWLILNKKQKVVESIKKVLGILSINTLKIPKGVFHSKNHTWAFMERSGNAVIGIDELLLNITGDVKVQLLKNENDVIKKGDAIAEIFKDGKRLSVYSPVSGEIVSTNLQLNENHEVLQNDPYCKGWLYNILPSNWMPEVSSYYLMNDTTNWLRSEIDRYKDFLAKGFSKYSPESSITVLQDGGELTTGTLSAFPDELWSDFQNEFMNPN